MRYLFNIIPFLALVWAGAALADSPYHRTLHGDSTAFAARVEARREVARTNKGVRLPLTRFWTTVPGEGVVHFTIKTARSRNWPASLSDGYQIWSDPLDVVLLQGQAVIGHGTNKRVRPLAGAIYRENGIERVFLNFTGSDKGAGTRVYELKAPFRAKGKLKARLRPSPIFKLSGRHCGAALASHGINFTNPGRGHAASEVSTKAAKVVTLRTMTDHLYAARHGSTANAVIASIINTADIVYRDQLGLTFRIAEQIGGFTQTINDAHVTLERFNDYINATYAEGSVSLSMLFSGEAFLDEIAGLAYAGVVCDLPKYSTSLVQDNDSSIDWITLAHEVGHSFSALHTPDDENPQTIMYPSLGSDHTSFAATSVEAIKSFVAEHGSCLASDDSTPPTDIVLPEIDLSAAISRDGTLVVQATLDGSPVNGALVKVYIAPDWAMRPRQRRTIVLAPGPDGTVTAVTQLSGKPKKKLQKEGRKIPRKKTAKLYLFATYEYQTPEGLESTSSYLLKLNLGKLRTPDKTKRNLKYFADYVADTLAAQ